MEAHATTPSTDAAAPEAGTTGAAPASATPAPLWPRLLCGAVALFLIGVGAFLPAWQASLSAPQYPAGLSLTAYGYGEVKGDIDEVNELNHYVGMKAFDTKSVPETALWFPTMAVALVGVVLITFVRRPRWLHRLFIVGIWLVPIGVLLDVQYRLWEYGHSVQPDAAIRVDPFTPLVVGPTKVLNFTTWAYPGLGTAAFFLAAAILTFGPKLLGRLTHRSDRDVG